MPSLAEPLAGPRDRLRDPGRCRGPSAPALRSAAAWPPSPRVPSTARRAPDASCEHGVAEDGEVEVGHRMSWEAASKENTPSARANGVPGIPGAGLTGLEPATSAVTVRHSNQAELQPPMQRTIITGGASGWKAY